jgi:hypothetical protein
MMMLITIILTIKMFMLIQVKIKNTEQLKNGSNFDIIIDLLKSCKLPSRTSNSPTGFVIRSGEIRKLTITKQ